MSTYLCKRTCFWRGRCWTANKDLVEIEDAAVAKPENASVAAHFEKVAATPAPKPAVPKSDGGKSDDGKGNKEPTTADQNPDDNETPPDGKTDEGEGSKQPPVATGAGEPAGDLQPGEGVKTDSGDPVTARRLEMIRLLQKAGVTGWNARSTDERLQQLLKAAGIEFN